MKCSRYLRTGLCLFALWPWLGCAVKAPPPKPVAVVPRLEANLLGVWENQARSGAIHKMIFEPGGRLAFQGGLEFFNPGHWVLDPSRQELRLTFAQAGDEKLQIFKLYVGDGVKALDRPNKQVTYRFTEETYALNVAGWRYSKAAQGRIQAVPEPELK